MQELRLVAVSEDGSYLVLATPGRGTRFMLPIDERLRVATRGHVSRFGQLQIGVESPLRPKEIQARIRAGATAEEIAETAGIPVERVRSFEGPVLQERQYIAEQAQRTSIRRPGDTSPGRPLGELVDERLGARGVAVDDDLEWDSWKREDGTWKVRLHFQLATRPHTAEWIFDVTRRQISPVDEEAARISSPDELPQETAVTPFVPRRTPEPQPEPEPVAAPAEAVQAEQPAVQPEEELHEQPQAVPAEAASATAAAAAVSPEPAQPDGHSGQGGNGSPGDQGGQAEQGKGQNSGQSGQQGQRQQGQNGNRKSSRRGRASVPSWDEIMFSTNRRRD